MDMVHECHKYCLFVGYRSHAYWQCLIERVYALCVIVYILGQPRCYDNLSQKWSKMMIVVHLSTDNSETEVVPSLKKAYSSDGVPTLNMASKVEFLKPLRSTLQSYKVQEAKKKADFSRTAHSQKTAHPSRSAYSSVPIQRLCPCHPFVAVAHTRFEVESHKRFPLFALALWQKIRANLLGHNSESTVPV